MPVLRYKGEVASEFWNSCAEKEGRNPGTCEQANDATRGAQRAHPSGCQDPGSGAGDLDYSVGTTGATPSSLAMTEPRP